MSNERISPNQLPKTCPWVMRIGVFFDGTGNNKANDMVRNKASNIAKLSELYKRIEDKEDLIEYEMIYENGVGTTDGVDDDDYETRGLGFGEGGIERVHRAIKAVATFFDGRPCSKEFIVDVFGFSRGAAQARHFINELHDRAAGPDVKVGFVGLFDTVASFGSGWIGAIDPTDLFSDDAPGDNINCYEVTEYQGIKTQVVNHLDGMTIEAPYYKTFIKDFNFHLSSASADYVEHFVARDEIRENFPLSDLEPNDGGFLKQKTYIGVHSDIGGGYSNEAEDAEISNYVAKISTRYRSFRNQEVRFLSDEKVAKIKGQYRLKGYELSEKKRGETVWLYGTKTVKKELSNVYMQLMHMKATMAEVPFRSLPNDEEHNIPEDLTDYAMAVLNNNSFPRESELNIYQHYVHQSHIDSEDRSSLSEMAHAPEDSGIRTIFPNNSTFAVIPEENDDPSAKGAGINTDHLNTDD